MTQEKAKIVLAEGQHARLVAIENWEFAERKKTNLAVALIAITDQEELILVEQYRPPMASNVVELPAGLIGDEPGAEHETLIEAAKRELLEETGFEAGTIQRLTQGPVSPGICAEEVILVFAGNLKKVGAGGGVDDEDIIVHQIPLRDVEPWVKQKQADACKVDPKIFAGLYFASKFIKTPNKQRL